MTAAKTSLVSPLDTTAAAPLYRQIYDRFRGAIDSGTLKPGDRVPSVRALTKELGLARGTIDAAYSLLAAEGYIQARGQAGTVVTPGLTLRPRAAGQAASHGGGQGAGQVRPHGTRRASNLAPPPAGPLADATLATGLHASAAVRPFQMGLPALDEFPRKLWARLGARCVRTLQPVDTTHSAVHGHPELRARIAAYLQVSRGIDCTPEQVFITSGYRHTLGTIAHALLKAGDQVCIEDPCYPPTRELLHHMQMQLMPVRVDGEGMRVSDAMTRAPRARAVVVTPAHQSPTCVTLSLPRRLALLDWAVRNKAWIVEDDYDGEYRYASRPLSALKSLDREGRVLYAGTFSKVLFPSLRLAYLVVPPAQVARFQQVLQVFAGGSPQLTQAVVSAFMAEGHFARHIQRMRRLYAERRDATAAGLARVLGEHVEIEAQAGGMHLVLRLRHQQSDRELVARMRAAGLSGEALTLWARGRIAPALLLNFTNVASQASAEALGKRILALL
ncbi:8-amino-7-oxononanoate synthase [Cupriavidus sp. H19C3]|uniref:MocR-like pyridoxine biosynthesis transcription factor PdxR n=1 Tax=Cupriavidus sp. H19C3 TaxID=3241603 RepID=UPI003BF8D171